jgi:hypothetical protein
MSKPKIASRVVSKKQALPVVEKGQILSSTVYETDTTDLDLILADNSKLEACEIVANVTFWGREQEQSLVMFECNIDKHFVENSASSFKIMKQDDLIKKSIKEVPIWEYGSNTREKLSKCQMYTLIGDKAVKENDARRKAAAKLISKKEVINAITDNPTENDI